MQNVSVMVILSTGDGRGKGAEEQWRKAFEALVRELPGLRSVIVGVHFIGSPVKEESRRKGLVDAVMGLVGVFRGVERLELVCPDLGPEFQQRVDIVRECRERVGAGVW